MLKNNKKRAEVDDHASDCNHITLHQITMFIELTSPGYHQFLSNKLRLGDCNQSKYAMSLLIIIV